MIKIIVILFFATILLFAADPARAEEKSLSESSVMAGIRPEVEYITNGSKEPFQDYFSKKKLLIPVAVEGEVVKETKPSLPALTVQGVIWGGSMPCAIINNTVVRQGDSIAEVELIKIEKGSIEVLYKGWNYSLSSPANLTSSQKPEGGKNE